MRYRLGLVGVVVLTLAVTSQACRRCGTSGACCSAGETCERRVDNGTCYRTRDRIECSSRHYCYKPTTCCSGMFYFSQTGCCPEKSHCCDGSCCPLDSYCHLSVCYSYSDSGSSNSSPSTSRSYTWGFYFLVVLPLTCLCVAIARRRKRRRAEQGEIIALPSMTNTNQPKSSETNVCMTGNVPLPTPTQAGAVNSRNATLTPPAQAGAVNSRNATLTPPAQAGAVTSTAAFDGTNPNLPVYSPPNAYAPPTQNTCSNSDGSNPTGFLLAQDGANKREPPTYGELFGQDAPAVAVAEEASQTVTAPLLEKTYEKGQS